jgi:hypothetical protein
MVQIYIPFTLDLSAGAIVFGETYTLDKTEVDYEFQGNLYNLTPSDLKSAWLYKDQDNGDALFKVTSEGETKVKDTLHLDIVNNKLVFNLQGNKSKFDGARVAPDDADVGEMVVKAIASCLFGHPEAQASIKNDALISSQITKKEGLPNEFVVRNRGINELDGDFNVNDALKSYFEQLIASDPERFSVDENVERGIPFKQGDTLVMDVNINVNIATETQTYNQVNGFSIPHNVVMDVNSMFNGSPGYDDNNSRLAVRKWRLVWNLAHDYLNASSPEAIAVGADGKLPVSDPSGGWKYEKMEDDDKNKINWYFYGDMSGAYSFNQMDCFYVKVNIPSGSKIPWLTVYSAPEGDGNDGSSWYRSRWNMTGYYDEGGNNVARGRDIIMYFGRYTPNNTFDHIDGSDPELNVLTYRQSEVSTNVGPRNDSEKITLIALSTDSGVSAGEYNFTVKQAGYRIASKTPVITSLV